MWGDYGYLHFWAHADAIKSRTFDRVWVTVDSS
jgi:uncharacterized protein YwqG